MEKYTNKQIAEIVETEGLEYTITSYLSIEKIEDEEMKKMFQEAAEILKKIEDKLEDYCEEE